MKHAVEENAATLCKPIGRTRLLVNIHQWKAAAASFFLPQRQIDKGWKKIKGHDDECGRRQSSMQATPGQVSAAANVCHP